MHKYFIPIIIIIAAAIGYLGAKPSWVIHNGTNPAELGARVTDIENNFDTSKVTLDSITTAVITTATITTGNITTGAITTLRAGTTDITAADSITCTGYFRAAIADITTGDTIKTTYLRGSTGSDIIGADSITTTVLRAGANSDIIGADSLTATVIRGGANSDIIGADSITAALVKTTSDVVIGDTLKALYIGNQATDRSWRIVINGDSLRVEQRVSGNWTRATAFAP